MENNQTKIKGFKTISKNNYPCIINWNDFKINIPDNFNGICNIYVDILNGNIQENIKKIEKIKKIPNLKEVNIYSSDYRVARVFNSLLKGFNVIKKFNLLNDFEFKERSEIDFSKLDYNEVNVPFDYIMYGIKHIGINNYSSGQNKNNIFSITGEYQENHSNIQEKVNSIIDEIFGQIPLEKLDDIDKSVLVSNWIQKNIQFVEGYISEVGEKKYICDDIIDGKKFPYPDGNGDILQIANNHFGVCRGIARLSVALLSNPKVGCKCNMANTSNHAFFTQIINNKTYVVDNTWCITRNPHHMGESLKAASFSDEYLLIGEDKINENEDILSHHTRENIYKEEINHNSISRERIKQSIKKLKKLGVSFEYNNPPIIIQYEEKTKSKGKHR